jgi:predicted phosphoribosyltransferase
LDELIEHDRQQLLQEFHSCPEAVTALTAPLDHLSAYTTILLVTDGIFFGRRVRATAATLRKYAPRARLVLAAPSLDPEVEHIFHKVVDEVILLKRQTRHWGSEGTPFAERLHLTKP